MKILIWFYVFFTLATAGDSLFYGIGKNIYITLQSICINFVFCVQLFIFYKLGTWHPDIISITVMFGFSLVIDALFTYLFLVMFFKGKLFKKSIKANPSL